MQKAGLTAYISSGTFRKLNFGGPLRQYLTSQTTLLEMIDFGEQQVFTGAITYPMILLMRKQTPAPNATVLVKTSTDVNLSASVGQEYTQPSGDGPWMFTNAKLQHLLHGWDGSTPLGKLIDGPVYRGVTTGLNDAFVIDQKTRQDIITAGPQTEQFIKPFSSGESLRPYYQKHNAQWLIVFPAGWTQKTYGKGLSESEAWEKLSADHPGLVQHWASVLLS